MQVSSRMVSVAVEDNIGGEGPGRSEVRDVQADSLAGGVDVFPDNRIAFFLPFADESLSIDSIDLGVAFPIL